MTETNWNELVEEYNKRGFPLKDWIYGYKPVLELLGNIAGKTILDYGCGSGKFSRELAKRGAKVIAVDPTEKMLELAKREDTNSIEYRRVTSNEISFLDKVDEAVSTYVLCGRRNDDEVVEIVRNICEKLHIGGSFVLLDPHPNNRQEADQSGLVRICLEGMQSPVFDYLRPVERYTTLIRQGGFSVDTVLEPKDEQGNPQMLIVRGRKCTK